MLIKVDLKGTTPLICDRFHEGALLTNQKTTKGEELSPKEQCIPKLYTDDKGSVIWPADNLMTCIINAGRFIKVGKRQLSTRDTSIVGSFLSIVEPYSAIKSTTGWRVFEKGIVNQVTKGRHMCYRPLFDDWEITFTLDIDTSEIQENVVRNLVDRAGKAIGLGVMRPDRKGRYGIFVVKCWHPQKTAKVVKELMEA